MIEFYDAYNSQSFESVDAISDSQDRSVMLDDDKIQHTRIGRTELSVDKVLQNLMVLDEYVTFRNIVSHGEDDDDGGEHPVRDVDDDLYSSHSNYRSPEKAKGHHHNLADLIRGRLHLALRAELAEDYLPRMEALKRKYVEDSQAKLESLKANIEMKLSIIQQGIDNLFHITFDPVRGLIVD